VKLTDPHQSNVAVRLCKL